MNTYQMASTGKHIHKVFASPSPSPTSMLRGNESTDPESVTNAFLWVVVILLAFVVAALVCRARRRRVTIIFETPVQAPHIEPSGSSTSINMSGATSPLLEQKLSPVRRSRSQDPLVESV